MSRYFENVCAAMAALAADDRAVFIGQAVKNPGTAMFNSLRDVPMEKRLEFPVAEDCQLGFCIGLSLAGQLPICIFPRINFLLLATNQLVLHLDKLPLYSGYRPKVIIRTAVATPEPLDPGPQHLGDFTEALRLMLRTVAVVRLDDPGKIVYEYEQARDRDGSTLLIEDLGRY